MTNNGSDSADYHRAIDVSIPSNLDNIRVILFEPQGPLNIGGVAMASVLELANAVIEASGRELEFKFIDPREELGELFEEVAVRVPALERLAALGCGVPSMDLQGIVADTFARHGELLGSIYGRGSCESRAS
mgnify:CR=1 FL=1